MTVAVLLRSPPATNGWLLSVLLHAGVLALLATSWSAWQAPAPAPATLAIEATVVESRPARRAEPRVEPRPQPPPAPVAETAPPPAARKMPEPAVIATPVPKAVQPAVQRPQPPPPPPAPARDLAAEREAALAQEREAALRASLAAEERANALRGSAAATEWHDALRAHIERQWRRPASARAGLRCVVLVNQIPGGEVVSARITECNGDDAVRQSIEAAAFRASPLPQPPDPALFERRLELVFTPGD